MNSRRSFIKTTALGSAAFYLPITCLKPEEKLGIALVGLGSYSTHQLAPALQLTSYCELRGLVTGSPEKIPQFKEKYGIQDRHIYSYESFDEIAADDAIDIVYVVTPNALHRDFVIRAARAGKHVICEKPMEISSDRCMEMIKACEDAGVKLQIGYRCQYNPYHKEFMRLGQEEILGKVRVMEAGFSFFGVFSKNWRFTDASLSGGGPLMDIGIYAIQACRYGMGKEPLSVTAQKFKTYKDYLPDMEETITWQFEFEDQVVANCISSYAARNNFARVHTEKSRYEMGPCYGYETPTLIVDGEEMDFGEETMQTTQMDAFARNILDDTEVIADGMEGYRDMVIIESIYKAAETGEKISINLP